MAQLLMCKMTHLPVLMHIFKGTIQMALQTKGHLQLDAARSIHPLNILNDLCEAFLAFFFP